jgi:hypothetical protein
VIIIAAEFTKQFDPYPVVSLKWLDALSEGQAVTEDSLADYGFLFAQAPPILLYSLDREEPEARLWAQQTTKLITRN